MTFVPSINDKCWRVSNRELLLVINSQRILHLDLVYVLIVIGGTKKVASPILSLLLNCYLVTSHFTFFFLWLDCLFKIFYSVILLQFEEFNMNAGDNLSCIWCIQQPSHNMWAPYVGGAHVLQVTRHPLHYQMQDIRCRIYTISNWLRSQVKKKKKKKKVLKF